MGLLTAAAQVIYGVKTFKHGAIFEGPVKFKDEITRTKDANFKLDMNGATTDWGTKKRIARYTVPGTLTTSGTITCDVSAGVPAGTKAVTLAIRLTDATVGSVLGVRETGSTTDQWRVVTQVANQIIDGNGDVQLNSSYTFDIENSQAMTTVFIFVTAVYL